MPRETAYLSIGSNQGRRAQNIRRAILRLSQEPGTRVERASSFYETSPVGFRQAPFLNAALKIKTAYTPNQLLKSLKKIESALGRKRGLRWGPRPADLDVIFHGRRCIETRTLVIPHPRFRFRRFVLIPLLELSPGLKDPATGKTIRQILRDLTSPDQRVKLYHPAKRSSRRRVTPKNL
jgi:2-amino-4-hydroxy-6-hydroxymethyldihydropteridine diphosphokinase